MMLFANSQLTMKNKSIKIPDLPNQLFKFKFKFNV